MCYIKSISFTYNSMPCGTKLLIHCVLDHFCSILIKCNWFWGRRYTYLCKLTSLLLPCFSQAVTHNSIASIFISSFISECYNGRRECYKERVYTSINSTWTMQICTVLESRLALTAYLDERVTVYLSIIISSGGICPLRCGGRLASFGNWCTFFCHPVVAKVTSWMFLTPSVTNFPWF